MPADFVFEKAPPFFVARRQGRSTSCILYVGLLAKLQLCQSSCRCQTSRVINSVRKWSGVRFCHGEIEFIGLIQRGKPRFAAREALL